MILKDLLVDFYYYFFNLKNSIIKKMKLNKNSYSFRIIFTYLLVNLALILLSLIFLIYHNYYVTTSLVIGAVFGLANIFSLFKTTELMSKENPGTAFLLFLQIFRMILLLLGLVLSFLVIYLTNDSGDKKTYFYILFAAIPYFVFLLVSMLIREKNRGE